MTCDYSVILVNYNAGEHLRRCLASLARALDQIPWEAVVVDNASRDASPVVAASFDQVRLHRNTENLGFARGVNQGLAMTFGRYVLIVNPDCEVDGLAIRLLRDELERHAECAVVGPRICDPDGATQGSARGDPTLLTGLFGRATLATRLFPGSRLARRNVRSAAAIESRASSVEVDWVSGACMLARRQALEAVNGFDGRFFLYWEDADVCRRLRARQMTIRYVPEAHVMHRVGASSARAPALAIRAFHRSAYLYYVTHVARSSLNPARWFAKVALSLRCGWHLFRARASRRPPAHMRLRQ